MKYFLVLWILLKPADKEMQIHLMPVPYLDKGLCLMEGQNYLQMYVFSGHTMNFNCLREDNVIVKRLLEEQRGI